MKSIIFWLLWGAPLLLSAQSEPDSLPGQTRILLRDLPAMRSMAVDDEANIFLLDQSNRIYKYLKLAGYDSALVMGGKSVRSEGFLNPTQLSTRNRQSLYLLDEGLQRIILFNPNLKIVQEIDFLSLNASRDVFMEGEAILPASFDIGPTGELFVLNGQDNKVYKIDLFGQIESSFGGPDYGEGSLFAPAQLQLTEDNRVLVSDTSEQLLQVYNLYGIFEGHIAPDAPFRWQDFCLAGNALCFYRGNALYLFDPRTEKGQFIRLPSSPSLQQVVFKGGSIYLLYENQVHLRQK
jgi:hypothetical protein